MRDSWKSVDRFKLIEAACLWCNQEPSEEAYRDPLVLRIATMLDQKRRDGLTSFRACTWWELGQGIPASGWDYEVSRHFLEWVSKRTTIYPEFLAKEPIPETSEPKALHGSKEKSYLAVIAAYMDTCKHGVTPDVIRKLRGYSGLDDETIRGILRDAQDSSRKKTKAIKKL